MSDPKPPPPSQPDGLSVVLPVDRRYRFSIRHLLLALTLCAASLGIYSYLYRDQWIDARRAKLQRQTMERLVAELPQLPKTIGTWGTIDESQSSTPFPQAKLNGWLVRTYRQAKSQKMVHVCVTVGPTQGVTQLPLGIIDRFQSRQLVFTGEPIADELDLGLGSSFQSWTNHAHGRRGPALFLRWSHWTSGQWIFPREYSQYAYPNDAAVQLCLVYDGPPIEERGISAKYLRTRDPGDVDFLPLFIRQLADILQQSQP